MKILIALLLISYVFAASDLTFRSGAKAVANSGEFSVRKVDAIAVPFLGLYSSVDVSGQATSNTSGTLKGGLILCGASFVPTQVPITFMATFRASLNVSFDANIINFDATASANLIVTAYSHIEERSPSGTVVRTVVLKNLLFETTSGSNAEPGKNATLYYIKFTAKGLPILYALKTGEELEFSFLVSTELGTVPFGNLETVVTPRTFESVITITGWDYKDNSNHLVLITGAGTGSISGDVSGSAQASIVSGTGDDRVYAFFSEEAEIDGKLKDGVVIKKTATGTVSGAIDNVAFTSKLTGKFAGQASAQIVEIDFIKYPGADKIIYDPTLGAGNPIQPSSSSSLIVCALLAVVALLL